MAKLQFCVVARVCYRLCDEQGKFLTGPLVRHELAALIAARWPHCQSILLTAIEVARKRWTSIPGAAQQRDNPWVGAIAEARSKAEPTSVQARVCYRLQHPDGGFYSEAPLMLNELVSFVRKQQPGLSADQLSEAITAAKATGTSRGRARQSNLDGPWEGVPTSKAIASSTTPATPKKSWWPFRLRRSGKPA